MPLNVSRTYLNNMTIDLVSGGCGFVGRNMVKRLVATTSYPIIVIDDLSVGTHPDTWLDLAKKETSSEKIVYGENRVFFIQADFRDILHNLKKDPSFFGKKYGIEVTGYNDVFHFAAIVGGRATYKPKTMLSP